MAVTLPRGTTKRGISWSGVCRLALRLPGVVQGTSYGTPALHVCKTFLARLKEDGETMAIKMDYANREVLLELDPSVFYLTDHYRPYPAVLVRLKEVPVGLVFEILEKAWRFQAPKGLATSHGQSRTHERGATTKRRSRPRSNKGAGRTTTG